MVSLSIIIATCGRPERLARCLDAVEVAMRTWGGEGEVIVVDNHPKYEAEDVVRGASCVVRGASEPHQAPSTVHQAPSTQHQAPSTKHQPPTTPHPAPITNHQAPLPDPESRIPNLASRISNLESRLPNPQRPVRYFRSVPFNKAKALNAGIAAARGEWLVFTDDDTLPAADWLQDGAHYAEISGVRVFGGRVMPGDDPPTLPRWLRPGRSGRVPGIGVHVRYEPVSASGVLSMGMTAPFGANLFVHKDVFKQHGGYDEDLWRLCEMKWPVGCEDSEFGYRLHGRAVPIGYCREALVVHPVNLERASLRLHLRRAYCEGWRQPLVFSEERRALLALYHLRLVLRHGTGCVVCGSRRDPAGAAFHAVEAARILGNIVGRWSGAYRERRRSKGLVP